MGRERRSGPVTRKILMGFIGCVRRRFSAACKGEAREERVAHPGQRAGDVQSLAEEVAPCRDWIIESLGTIIG